MPPSSGPTEAEILAVAESAKSIALIGINSQGLITYWGKAAERLFGHPAESAAGRALFMIFPAPDLYQATMERVLLAARNAGHTQFETYFARSFGPAFYGLMRVSQAEEGFAILIEEVSNHRSFHSQLSEVLDSIGEAVIVLDADMRYVALNQAACLWVDRDRDHLLGKRVADVFPEYKDHLLYVAAKKMIEEPSVLQLSQPSERGDYDIRLTGHPLSNGGGVFIFSRVPTGAGARR
jgi:PAS domain S-box-containing protein